MSAVSDFPGDPTVDEAQARAHKLTGDEYARLVRLLGRAPTYAELGVVSVLWSEHCSYKSSRVHLARLPSSGVRVVCGPGENAGVVDIGDGFAAVFKMESHNHPSFIEPYQGAATGVGGILRDVFTMGARPVALLDSLRFGRPEHPRTAALLRGVVAGIGGYGNAVGVPTVGGDLAFDGAYDDNILVNAFACGVVRRDRLVFGRASGVGNTLFYLGAKTGRDGIHGATMASDTFRADAPSARPTMQVGDPFVGKLLLEACVELAEQELVVGLQDMGAAGLSSASVEMAARAGTGLELDLDAVPRRAFRLSPYELLLSESQERMLLVCEPANEARVRAIAAKWTLDLAAIGHVTGDGRWVVKATPNFDPLAPDGEPSSPHVVCDLPVTLLTRDAPSYERAEAVAPHEVSPLGEDAAVLGEPEDWGVAFLRLLSCANLGSRAWVYRQYDATVRGGTQVGPGAGDAAVVRVPCERDGVRIDKWLAFAADGNGRLVSLDPYEGAAMAVAEVCRNLVCVGAEPLGLTDCLNFGSPEDPRVMRQFARAIDGIAAACRALGVPIVSGNVSLFNETDGRAIHPTPTIAGVGLVADPHHALTMAFPEAELDVVLVAPRRAPAGPLGGSEYVAARTSKAIGIAPRIDLEQERALQRVLLECIREVPRLVRSAHDVSDGGLAVALAECCTSESPGVGAIGAEVALPPSRERLAARLFGEAPSRVLVTAAPKDFAALARRFDEAGLEATRLGRTGGSRLVVHAEERTCIDVALAVVAERRAACLDGAIGEG
jgi:phosphoribosylformylglycinamidine synthase II